MATLLVEKSPADVSVLETSPCHPLFKSRSFRRDDMFGKKSHKTDRLLKIGRIVREERGITQAELARRLRVSRGTINKDLSIIQERAGILLTEDEHGRLHWFD
jgi:DNA-binding CsgD family transcriptional regulator